MTYEVYSGNNVTYVLRTYVRRVCIQSIQAKENFRAELSKLLRHLDTCTCPTQNSVCPLLASITACSPPTAQLHTTHKVPTALKMLYKPATVSKYFGQISHWAGRGSPREYFPDKRSGEQLQAVFYEAWDLVTQGQLDELIDSMQACCQAVVDANRSHPEF